MQNLPANILTVPTKKFIFSSVFLVYFSVISFIGKHVALPSSLNMVQ